MLAVLGGPDFPSVSNLGNVQILGNLRTNLGGVAVDGLLAEHDHVELDAFQLLDLLLSLGEDVAGGQGVGSRGRCEDGIDIITDVGEHVRDSVADERGHDDVERFDFHE